MEGRLRSAIESGDFYSAHQTLLSHSQRLERSGRHAESSAFLYNGILALHAAEAPVATVFDVISKFVAVTGQVPSEAGGAASFLGVLKVVLSYKDVPHSFSNFWSEFAKAASERCEGAETEVVEILLENLGDADRVAQFCLDTLPDEEQVFVLLGPHLAEAQFLSTGLTLLSSKCFASALALRDAYASANTSLEDAGTRSPNIVYRETCRAGQAANLVLFLFELLRRKGPLRDLFVQLHVRYAELLNDGLCKHAWNRVKETYWPSKQSHPVNPLASLMQSMMMNQ